MKRTAYLSTGIGLSLTALSVLFKVMHWPGANIGLVLGIASLAFVAVPSMAIYKYSKS